jgi:hypothetical protein
MGRLAEPLKVPPETLAALLTHRMVDVISPDWLSECLKQRCIIEKGEFMVDIELPKKQITERSGGSGGDEEEKNDKVVRLEDILEDVYAMKFGRKKPGAKKRNMID